MTEPNWITLHRLRFPTPVSAADQVLDPPEGPTLWRFCPLQAVGDDDLPTWRSDVWGGFAVHETEAEARAFFDTAEERLSHIPGQAEGWHALTRVLAHRGEVRWRGHVETDSALRGGPCAAEGPLVVLTTAGYIRRDPADIPRIKLFMRAVEAVVATYRTLPGNISASVFNGGFDGREGFTLSLWSDDRAMVAAAYKPGEHRSRMTRNETEPYFDRSSFTRARLVRSRGLWDGRESAHPA